MQKTGCATFVKISAEILGNVEILSDFANALTGAFINYRRDVELFGEEARRLRLTVVERRVESEASSPSFPTRAVMLPRRARTSSRLIAASSANVEPTFFSRGFRANAKSLKPRGCENAFFRRFISGRKIFPFRAARLFAARFLGIIRTYSRAPNGRVD